MRLMVAKRIGVLCVTAAACVCASQTLGAADGVLLTQKTTSGTESSTQLVQIEKNRMRTDVTTDATGPQVAVFDGAKQVMTIISPSKRTYMELTKADLDGLAGQMQGMAAQMQAMMANMPPAQRAQMEAMMGGRGMPGMGAMGGGAVAAPAKTAYRRAGTDRVGKWACDKYDGYQNDQKTSEICTVAPAALGVAAADLDVARQMGEFFRALVPQAADQLVSVGRMEDQGFTGIPVRRTFTIAGKSTTIEIVDVSHKVFTDADFAVPAGFTKQDMLGAMGRGR